MFDLAPVAGTGHAHGRSPGANPHSAAKGNGANQPPSIVRISGMAGRKCIFCGGGPLTREHVFGEWFRKLVDIREPRPGSVTHHVPGSAVEHDFEAVPAARTARFVCGDCNNGWMAALEEQASVILTPLLQGQSGTLSEADLEILARWAFKTAYVLDAASPGAGAGFPGEQRAALRDDGTLPARSAVWMTTWPGTTAIWTSHWGLALGADENEEADGPNTTEPRSPSVPSHFASTQPRLRPSIRGTSTT